MAETHNQIIDSMGEEIAERLSLRFGGARFWIPAPERAYRSHPFKSLMTEREWEKFCFIFGYNVILISKQSQIDVRNRKMRQMYKNGLTVRLILKHFNFELSERQAYRIVKEAA